MEAQIYKEVREWMYRNARPVDLCLWQYYFEQGKKEDVVSALLHYQNADGGFGHALEADNWNPESTPITTQHALKILEEIGFFDMEHPVYQGIFSYLESGKDLREYGWCFTVPGNDKGPHAPWWNYSEEFNRQQYFGVTAEFCAFILKWGDRESALYRKALDLTDTLLEKLMSGADFGDSGIAGYITLVESLKEAKLNQYDCEALKKVLAGKIRDSIEYDTTKWETYVTRPSSYIQSPESVFFEENAEIVKTELNYLKDTRPEGSVWGITWTWFDQMEKYSREFAISENWWKGYHAIEKMKFLRNFEAI